jgi:PAS domain S-box-containing protein
MSEVSKNWRGIDPILQDLPVAYTEVDATGKFRRANKAACRMFDMPKEELLGHAVWDLVPADEAVEDRAQFLRSMESGESGEEPPTIRRSLFNAKGDYRMHELHRRMIRDENGLPIGIRSVTFDLSELEAVHHEATQAKLWLESVIEAIPQAVIVLDALGFVRHANPAAAELTGWPAREQVGKQIEAVMPIIRASSKSNAAPTFRMALHESWNGDVEFLTRQRQTVAVWLSASPIFDPESGYTNGVVLVLPSPRVRKEEPEAIESASEA